MILLLVDDFQLFPGDNVNRAVAHCVPDRAAKNRPEHDHVVRVALDQLTFNNPVTAFENGVHEKPPPGTEKSQAANFSKTIWQKVSAYSGGWKKWIGELL